MITSVCPKLVCLGNGQWEKSDRNTFKAFEDGGGFLFQLNSNYVEELCDFQCLLGSRVIPST